MNGCFVIAEAGVNHNGSLDMALRLVDVAADAGADAVKFQTFRADDLVLPGTNKAEYQKAQTGDGDQHSMIRALELSESDHQRIATHCAWRGIEFMSTAFDIPSVDLLVSLGIKRIKVASGDITNLPLVEHMARQNLPIILSTGMADMVEIEQAVGWIREVRSQHGFGGVLAEHLTILHCTSNYPAAYADVNLTAMTSIGRATGLPVGYSDHTLGFEISVSAVALGAKVIEKHFTLDSSLPGPDHRASLEPDSLRDMVSSIRHVEDALGDGIKQPTDSEIPIRSLVRRSAYLAQAVTAGHALREEDLVFLRPGDGISPADRGKLIGRKLAQNAVRGTKLRWTDLR